MIKNNNRIIKHYLPLSCITLVAAVIYYRYDAGKPFIVFVTDITGDTSLIIPAFTLLIGPLISGRKTEILFQLISEEIPEFMAEFWRSFTREPGCSCI